MSLGAVTILALEVYEPTVPGLFSYGTRCFLVSPSALSHFQLPEGRGSGGGVHFMKFPRTFHRFFRVPSLEQKTAVN